MLAAQPDKSILNVYNFQKDQLALKIVLPEKLSAIAVDPRGEFCAGGTVQGRIFLWEASSFAYVNSRHENETVLVAVDCFRGHVQRMGCPLPTGECSTLHPRWRGTCVRKRRLQRQRVVRVKVIDHIALFRRF